MERHKSITAIYALVNKKLHLDDICFCWDVNDR